jgi:hypothetical protein
VDLASAWRCLARVVALGGTSRLAVGCGVREFAIRLTSTFFGGWRSGKEPLEFLSQPASQRERAPPGRQRQNDGGVGVTGLVARTRVYTTMTCTYREPNPAPFIVESHLLIGTIAHTPQRTLLVWLQMRKISIRTHT